ncbi:tetratricopeptide repeat protein [Geobacter sp. AOG2]|uniref:tetratricopeptide repeat protein n=1 Tax=Geobacter sp. AOG2 TaxID=1566347 RepID=UPI001CC7C15A|nr:tetratricopeptide repeat protein [Geobacter sp. AOG2]GFE59664.1 hypothetical protein AOG2_02520 [Geobacter sp. AOG2]
MNGLSMKDQVAQAAYSQLQSYLAGDVPLAVERVEFFLKSHPDFAQAHNDLGVLYYRAGDLLRSLANYEKANRLDAGNPTFVKNLAEFYTVELGWFDDAIALLTGVLKNRPEDTEILGSLAAIGVKTGRTNEAEIFLDRILALEPWNQEAKSLLDDLRQGKAENGPSGAFVQEAPSAPPQIDAVLQGLRQSISDLAGSSETPEERYREAVLHAERGMVAEAVKELEELVKAAPDHALAFNDLGVLYYRLGDPGRSLSAHEQAVRLEPHNPTFRKNLANLCYSALGRTDEAICHFTEVLREYPQDVETLLALGQISAVNNLGEQARVFVSKALELEPWNQEAREFLELIT